MTEDVRLASLERRYGFQHIHRHDVAKQIYVQTTIRLLTAKRATGDFNNSQQQYSTDNRKPKHATKSDDRNNMFCDYFIFTEKLAETTLKTSQGHQ